MGWEIKNNQFFCNTSDTFFGPYLDESIWPDMDWGWDQPKTRLFYDCFCDFLETNPLKGVKETDPRGFSKRQLEKIVGIWEDSWMQLETAIETLPSTAKGMGLNLPDNISSSEDLFRYIYDSHQKALKQAAKKKKKVAKKKVVKKKVAKKKVAKKKATIKKAKKKTVRKG